MVVRGDLRRAIRFLTDCNGGQILFPSSIDDSSGRIVADLLEDKHPHLRDIDADHLHHFDSIPDFPEVSITEEVVEKVARKLSGSSGPVAFDSLML